MFFDRKSQRVIEGTREEILNTLKLRAKPSCKKCFGRGYTGYKALKSNEKEELEQRLYIPCSCIDK